MSLLAVYTRLGTGLTRAGPAEKWLFRVPFSVSLGWITVATIANATAYLVKAGWNGFGLRPEVWAVALIIVAALLAVAILASRRDAGYGLVVLWALGGIVIKRSADSSRASRASRVVLLAAAACGAVVAAAVIASAARSALKPFKA